MVGNIKSLVWKVLNKTGVLSCLNDRRFVQFQYEFLMNDKMKWEAPKNFNQKLQWLKLYYRAPLMIKCADKFEARDFVKERIGEQYLNEVIGLYRNVEEINFNFLPEAFVLKATHGSGWNIICPDKTRINWPLACKKMKKWLKSDFSRNGREWQYHHMQRRIVCEKFLHDGESSILRDYKIFAFDGECKYIWVDFDCESQEENMEASYAKPKVLNNVTRYRNIYDTNWVFQPDKCILRKNLETPMVKKPECLQEMLEIAAKLSKGFPQCRVDLYVLENKRIVFGELTFSSGNGCLVFIPASFGEELGGYIRLPNKTA